MFIGTILVSPGRMMPIFLVAVKVEVVGAVALLVVILYQRESAPGLWTMTASDLPFFPENTAVTASPVQVDSSVSMMLLIADTLFS